jgi:prepilin-type processing-associated H-X9-DG protein
MNNPRKRIPETALFPPPPTNRSGVAFTMVELLVVLALLGGLALLLVPALARTQPGSKTIQCLNNLRQWGSAQYMFASENSDTLSRDGMGANGLYGPGVIYNGVMTGTPDDQYAWFNVVAPYLGLRALSNYYHIPGGDPRNMYPLPWGTNAPNWGCPSATMRAGDYAQLAGGGYYGFFSYAMNIDLKQGYSYPAMPKLATLQKPSATVLFFDCLFNPVTEIANASPGYNSVNPASRFRSFGVRHGNGGAIGFLDGHARIFSAYYVTNNANADPEPARADIIWNASVRAPNP